MLKPTGILSNVLSGLITVQDNTMLKHSLVQRMYCVSLITVQDNTMLKL